MQFETSVISCDIGWCFRYKDFPADDLPDVLKGGQNDMKFLKLVAWLCKEIAGLYDLEETVHEPSSPETLEYFMLELSSLLGELGKSFFSDALVFSLFVLKAAHWVLNSNGSKFSWVLQRITLQNVQWKHLQQDQ